MEDVWSSTIDYRVPSPARTDFAIGVIGAGFILREVQLKAYRNAGFSMVGIASRTPEIAREVADLLRRSPELTQ
jgi:predicted homoserine dehydrogenase-like protein